ncbi:MAG: alpha/beta hydrolase [Vicinamibacteria bacterium]|nr:alpha/beta hydrolase [Vicinamibacteria bacterium]
MSDSNPRPAPVNHRRPRTSLSAWREAGRPWMFRGRSIFTRVAGRDEAPALLLIHGFPTASWDWEALFGPLTQSHRVFAADMMGFGFSDKPGDYSYTIAAQADLQESFLTHHGITAYGVLAHDYGDTVAQELLARQSEPGNRPKMRSLALLNGGLFPDAYRPLLMQKLLLSPLGPLVASLTTRSALARSLRKIFGASTQPDDELIDGAWRLITHNHGLAVVPQVIRYMAERKVHGERWVGALQGATIPLKLIDGGADPISGRHMAERYRELIPRPDITILEGIGHYPQCEAPDEVLGAFAAWAAGS